MIREIMYFLHVLDSNSLIKAIMNWNFSVSVLTYIWRKKPTKQLKILLWVRKSDIWNLV